MSTQEKGGKKQYSSFLFLKLLWGKNRKPFMTDKKSHTFVFAFLSLLPIYSQIIYALLQK